jgi:hypothetical protein
MPYFDVELQIPSWSSKSMRWSRWLILTSLISMCGFCLVSTGHRGRVPPRDAKLGECFGWTVTAQATTIISGKSALSNPVERLPGCLQPLSRCHLSRAYNQVNPNKYVEHWRHLSCHSYPWPWTRSGSHFREQPIEHTPSQTRNPYFLRNAE